MMSLNNKRASARGPGVQLPVIWCTEKLWRGCLAMLKVLLQLRRKDNYKEKISLIGGLDLFLKDETSLSLPEHLEQS